MQRKHFFIPFFLVMIYTIGCSPDEEILISQCLPSSIKLSDVVDPGIIVEQKLLELQAKCQNNKLVDKSGTEIYFYQLHNCWGNPPDNYQEINEQQQKDIDALNQQYIVIEMTCNPTNSPIG